MAASSQQSPVAIQTVSQLINGH